MSQKKILQAQAAQMHQLTKELLRKYQLRDRNEITCCGISVSQCYALDLLSENGPLAMASLAQKMFLDKSTATRIVDQLIKRGLVERIPDEQDRRKILVELTKEGRALCEELVDCQVQSQAQILDLIPPAERQMALDGLEALSRAVQQWLTSCCLPSSVKITPQTIATGGSNEVKLNES